MAEVVAKLDEMGQAAWLAVMALGFVAFWPVGLSILAYLLWSGRMGRGCNSGWHSDGGSRWERKMARFQDKMERWQARSSGRSPDRSPYFDGGFDGQSSSGSFAPSGNLAFDAYRAETLRRLEEEQGEFKSFLDRLREAKDKAEFDQFMADRRNRPMPDAGAQTTNKGINQASNKGPGDYPFGEAPAPNG
jgi:Protein of unknown function (DUF2852)